MSKLFIIFILFSCNDYLNAWEGYQIDYNQHHSHRIGLGDRIVSIKSPGRHMVFDARFTKSCLYTPKDDDINKLYGFTDCNSNVHDNSVRFGWRHNGNGTIEIFAYWYANGHRGFSKMGETKPDITDQYEIWARDDKYTFRFNGTEFSVHRTKNCERGLRIRLFPYFGGNERSPDNIVIFIYEY